jgi:hypothetical protein
VFSVFEPSSIEDAAIVSTTFSSTVPNARVVA